MSTKGIGDRSPRTRPSGANGTGQETPRFSAGRLICSASGGVQPAFVPGGTPWWRAPGIDGDLRAAQDGLRGRVPSGRATSSRARKTRPHTPHQGGLKATASRANEPPRPEGRGFINVDPALGPGIHPTLGPEVHQALGPGVHQVDSPVHILGVKVV